MNLVSIGLPVYNGENYLRKALDSILAQTFRDFELILCDNASNDSTESICQEFALRDSRIQYHRNRENVGAMPNFQRVLELAKGKYFKWAAHDDIYEPQWLETCVSILESNPEVILAYTRTRLMDSQGNELSKFQDPFNLQNPSASQRLTELVSKLEWCHAVFGLMRREIPISIPPMGSFIGSDTIYLAELALQGQFHENTSYFFRRRIHEASSQRANKSIQSLQAWFNPNKQEKIFLRYSRYLVEYFGAINRAKLPLIEKGRCYLFLIRFMNWRKNELWQEILLALSGKTIAEKI